MVDGATDLTLPSDVDLSQSTPLKPTHRPALTDSKRRLYESDRRPSSSPGRTSFRILSFGLQLAIC